MCVVFYCLFVFFVFARCVCDYVGVYFCTVGVLGLIM